MELLVYPKANYVQELSLGKLHNQSLEWLKDIKFWQDEMAFFYKLLHKKNTRKEVDIKKVEEMGIYLNASTEKLEKHIIEIQVHELVLASLLRDSSFKEEVNYRNTHAKLLKLIYEDQLMVMNFKITLFRLFLNIK